MNYEQQLAPHQHLIARVSQRFYQIIRRYPVDPIEFIGSVQAASYGVMLLSPLQTFASSRSFQAVQRYISEVGAGFLFLLIGTAWLIGLLTERRPVRLVASLCAAFLFTFWAVMLFRANTDGGGWLTYGIFAGTCMWAFWRQCSRD